MIEGFDTLIHQPARLRIMTTLCVLESDESVDFSYLKKWLRLTDGNLGAHLEKLDHAGYLKVKKTFVGRRPKTFVQATHAGRAAYEGHREALERLLRAPGGEGTGEGDT
ncbi:MAG: transcriptional regulator [Verrucomicrobiota bacterium]